MAPTGPTSPSGWTVDSKGQAWTFTIRPDARWQDGEPVTADDVVFTVDILKSPGYTGPLGASWRGVSVTAVDERTVRFDLDTPIGGFLQAATVGLLPAHLLSEAPIETLADDPFSLQPVGSGPFVLTSWNAESASLVPASAADIPAGRPGVRRPGLAVRRTDRAHSRPSRRIAGDAASPAVDRSAAARRARTRRLDAPGVGRPTPRAVPDATPRPRAGACPGSRCRSIPDAAALADAYRAGDLDAASGLPPDARGPARRAARQPALELSADDPHRDRPQPAARGHRAADRRGPPRPARRDRPRAIISEVFGGARRARRLADPAVVVGVRPEDASRQSGTTSSGPSPDFKAAGWKRLAGGWASPGTKKPYVDGAHSPDAETNPTAMAVAEAVAADWRAFGFQTNVTGLPPAEFVEDRLRQGKFQSAAIDVNIGLDPDLYPLLGSTQVAKGGSNVSGIQDVALDRDLIQARAPGTLEAPQGRRSEAPGAPGRQELPPADRLPRRARRARRPGPGTGRPRARGPQ